MDKDGDGKVSRAEFAGAPAMFDRLDADKDGSLSKDEAAQAPKMMLELLRAMDTDGDGKISRDEFRGPPERFDAARRRQGRLRLVRRDPQRPADAGARCRGQEGRRQEEEGLTPAPAGDQGRRPGRVAAAIVGLGGAAMPWPR